jgi:hypothetical protein
MTPPGWAGLTTDVPPGARIVIGGERPPEKGLRSLPFFRTHVYLHAVCLRRGRPVPTGVFGLHVNRWYVAYAK